MILDIDPDKCTGCMSCVLYCSLAHENKVIPQLTRVSILANPDRTTIIPVACIPCEEKPCLAACIEPGAIHTDKRGAVIIDESLCTACGKCARACLVGAIRVHRLAGRGKKGKAVAIKCDQCGGDPWCVKVCPTHAIHRINSLVSSQAIFDRILAAQNALKAEEKNA
jgi:anaerobic carbon-monoxide dehydrogenase iron sulfur subunit